MKIFVSQRIFPEGLEILKKAGLELDLHDANTPLPKEELMKRLKDADGLVCLLTDSIDREVLEGAKELKVVANVAVGYNNIDVKAATELGIQVTNTPDVLTEATADLTFGLLIAAARRISESERYLRDRKFEGWELFQPHLGLDVFDKTLGLVGMGRIGQAVARRARGFNMRVLYHNRSRVEEGLERELNVQYVEFDALLNESDFISIHAPLTDETKHLFSRPQFEKMKDSAILINTSRGPVVEEAALADALEGGLIRGAALDVFEEEPKVHPKLLELDEHVVLVPHIGSATYATRRAMSTLAAENAVAVLSERKPPSPVNEPRTE
jgi:glyoxylate reductase